MEKEGIGRPSTYASIIGTIIDRGYVRRNGTALVPTFTALVVSKLLSVHLPQFVDLGFTSDMEKSLDHDAEGDFRTYLDHYHKTGLKSQVESQEKKIDPDEARSINLPGLEDFVFRVRAMVHRVCTQRDKAEVCASLPENECPADITVKTPGESGDQKNQWCRWHAWQKGITAGLPIAA